ncbi:MAG: hypothetical protein V1916_01790, partial [Patescibacteria group bacterium]
QFLGDPDVNALNLKLYSFFGWGWGAEMVNYNAASQWLPPYNVSRTGMLRDYDKSREQSLVIGTDGSPHIAWSNWNAATSHYDIYYLRLKSGTWVTVTGEEYVPGTTDPTSSRLDVSIGAGLSADANDSRFPSLVLDAASQPHIALQEGGDAYGNSGSNLYYTRWDGTAWTAGQQFAPDPPQVSAQTPSLQISTNGNRYVAYRMGEYSPSEIYLKKSTDGAVWTSVTNNTSNLDVSDTPNTRSSLPRLTLYGEVPHVVWQDSEVNDYVYYRWWNQAANAGAGAWVTASGRTNNDPGTRYCSNNFNQTCTPATIVTDCGATAGLRCQPIDVSVNWGVRRCTGQSTRSCAVDSDCTGFGVCQGITRIHSCSGDWRRRCYTDADCAVTGAGICSSLGGYLPDQLTGEIPSVAVYPSGALAGRPAVVWRDPDTLLFRYWNGTGWVSANGSDNPFDDQDLRPYFNSVVSSRDLDMVIGNDNIPRVVWGGTDYYNSIPEIQYAQWNGTGWVAADNTTLVSRARVTQNVSTTPSQPSYSPAVALDRWGNPHATWSETKYSPVGCSFARDGAVNWPAGQVEQFAIDSTGGYLYMVGLETGTGAWRIEKRRLDTGALVTAFDTDGVITGASATNAATDVVIDTAAGYMYVVGTLDGARQWRIEKRRLDTGALVTAFDTDGYIQPSRYSYYGVNVTMDSNYLYVAGGNINTGRWNIQKYDKTTGALYAANTAGGWQGGEIDEVVSPVDVGSTFVKTVISDGTYLYIVGGAHPDDSTDWRIEKRRLDNGTVDTSFNGTGIINGPHDTVGLPNSLVAYDAILDGQYLYVGGVDDLPGEHLLVGKYDRTTGAPCTAAACGTQFGTNGFVLNESALAWKARALAVDAQNLYIGGLNRWHLEKRDKNNGNLISGTYANGWLDGVIERTSPAADYGVMGLAIDSTYMYAVGSVSPNWSTEKRYLASGVLVTPQHSNCTDSLYPSCTIKEWSTEFDRNIYYCAAVDVNYTKWAPGNVRAGLGWVEFMPAGALLGIPWVKTAYNDIYAGTTVQLAPPPRGSGQYTATYLILADGSISGIPTYYTGSQTGTPTSGYYQQGISSIIGGGSCSLTAYATRATCEAGSGTWTSAAGQPFGQNALSRINVDGLKDRVDGNKDRYGYTVENVPYIDGNDLSVQLTGSAAYTVGNPPVSDGRSVTLGGKVYYVKAGSSGTVSIDSPLTFLNGTTTGTAAGNGVIVIDGDLEINADVRYEKHCSVATGTACQQDYQCPTGESCQTISLTNINQMPSAGIIVRGNVYVSPLAHEVSSVLVAVDNPATTTISEGIVSTGRKRGVTYSTFAANDTSVKDTGVNTSGNQIVFGRDATNANRGYFRFPLTGIPAGAEIKSAYLRLTGDTTGSGDFKSRVYLVDSVCGGAAPNDITKGCTDSADCGGSACWSGDTSLVPFGGASNMPLYNVKTSNSVEWAMSAATWNSAGTNQSPDLKSLVQRFVSKDQYEAAKSIAFVLKEGDATAGETRGIWAADAGVNTAPQLVIEFAPKRVTYPVTYPTATATGATVRSGWTDSATTSLSVGWNGAALAAQRDYLSFTLNVPADAEILKSQVHTTMCAGLGGTAGFQLRQGLLKDYPTAAQITAVNGAPWVLPLSSDVSEVAQDVGASTLGTGSVTALGDISTQVKAFIGRDDYRPGITGVSEFGLRVRRGNDSTETVAGVGENRCITKNLTTLAVDYQVPLQVNGLLVARGYNFDRKYTRSLAPAEQIIYDGRVVANTPPGLSDFIAALPSLQRVNPQR